jgi:hypothetical protein
VLHRVNPPQCLNELQAILRFQREVLEFACTLTNSSLLSEASVKAGFVNTGGWLCGRLWENRKPLPFWSTLVAVIDHVKGDAALRQLIMEAFDHDITFNLNLNDGGFHFSYNTKRLDAKTTEILGPLLVAFYNDLLKTGYPPIVHGGVETITRDKLVASFWQANSEMMTCPACDGVRPDTVNGKVYSDEDHFFPKSKYPFLSIHAANLLPVCVECNRVFKLGRDPIDDHYNEPLLNTFHPYDSPALLHVEVQVSRTAPGAERQIAIVDRRAMPSRRVNRLNYVFKLEERWKKRLDTSVGMIIDQLRGHARLLRTLGQPLDGAGLAVEDVVRIALEDDLAVKREKIGKTHWYVLQSSYLQYALDDADEFELLLEGFLGA